MKKTGELLKKRRESSNLSLSEVALATKINPRILTAIENGDESKLPARTFLKGFLRSYATFLKMDADEIMRLYYEETGGTQPGANEMQRAEAVPVPTVRRRVTNEDNTSIYRTAAVIVIIVLIGSIIGVRELIEKYQREKVVESAEALKVTPITTDPAPVATSRTVTVPENEAAATAPSQPTAQINAPTASPRQTQSAETKAVNPTPAPTPSQESLPVGIKPPEKPIEVKVVEEPATTTTAATQTPPAATEANSSEQSNESRPTQQIKAAKHEIILEALDRVDVKFAIAGETRRLSLGPTQVHTIFADQPIMLDLSDGGAVNIILNGREKGPPGDLGKPKVVRIP